MRFTAITPDAANTAFWPFSSHCLILKSWRSVRHSRQLHVAAFFCLMPPRFLAVDAATGVAHIMLPFRYFLPRRLPSSFHAHRNIVLKAGRRRRHIFLLLRLFQYFLYAAVISLLRFHAIITPPVLKCDFKDVSSQPERLITLFRRRLFLIRQAIAFRYIGFDAATLY